MDRVRSNPNIIRSRTNESPIVSIVDEIDPELTPGRWREYCKKNSSDGET